MNTAINMRKFCAGTIILAFIAFFGVMLCEKVEARAGGGHRYSGSSRSSSSSSRSRSSSSNSWSSSSKRRSGSSSRSSGGAPMETPEIVFVFIAIIFVAIVLLKANDRMVDSTIRTVSRMPSENKTRVSLAKIKTKDPGFDEAAFIARTKKAFAIIQQAWTDRNLDKAEAFLSDGIYEQFNIQLAEMRENKVIDHLEGLNVTAAFPVGLQSDANFDVIHLRIEAKAVNYRKCEKTNRLIDGSKTPEPFSEVWTFLRKPGAKTGQKGGLMEGQCPNCGNPIKIGRLSKCDVCNALLRSGEYDWVLVAITQACEWKIPAQKSIPGLSEMVRADKEFNQQHLKERASVIFWRRVEAERTANIAFVRKVTLEDFCNQFAQRLKFDGSGSRNFYSSCAVGAIELLGIEMSEPFDRALLQIIWSGFPTTQKQGHPPDPAKVPRNITQIFSLVRKHGVASKAGAALASSHCPSCGAPEQTSEANECAYCGSVMNDGKIEWVLEEVFLRNDNQVTQILGRCRKSSSAPAVAGPSKAADTRAGNEQPVISGVELVRYTVSMMLADGQIDHREIELVKELAARLDINEQKLQMIISDLQASPNPVDYVVETSQYQPDRELMARLARVALADGKLEKAEVEMLKKVGEKIQLTPYEVDQMLKAERAKMYQEARDTLKNRNNPT